MPRLRGGVGQSADRRRKLYNGRIECTYYQFFGAEAARETAEAIRSRRIEDESATVLLVPARNVLPRQPPTGLRRSLGQGPEQAEIFRAACPSAPGTCGAGRRSWASPATGSTNTTSPRCRWSSIATKTVCTSPSSRGPRAHARRTRRLARPDEADRRRSAGSAAGEHLSEERGSGSGARRSTSAGRGSSTTLVAEGGLQFEVNLSDYLDTGLFLDHRITRGHGPRSGRRQAIPEPVRLHRLVQRLRGRGRGGLDA